MFGSLGFNEILFIMVLALLIFGPKRLPQIGRTLGKALGEFRRASSDLKRSMEVEMTMAEERETATGAAKPQLASGSESRQESEPELATYEAPDAAPGTAGVEPPIEPPVEPPVEPPAEPPVEPPLKPSGDD